MNNNNIKTRLEGLLESMDKMVQEAKDISYESLITGGEIHGEMDAYFIPWMEQFMNGYHQTGNLQSLIDMCDECDDDDDN